MRFRTLSPRLYARAAAVLLVSVLALSPGCGSNDTAPMQPPLEPTLHDVVDIILKGEPTPADVRYLEGVSMELWEEVGQYFRDNPGISEYVSSGQSPSLASARCRWDGATRRDRALCRRYGYKFERHNAVYFIVDGPADCYHKEIDRLAAFHCVPTHGCVSTWELKLKGGWYWRAGKWVKNVALLVPTTWWSGYYRFWSNDFKAQRFILRWNDQRRTGCCH